MTQPTNPLRILSAMILLAVIAAACAPTATPQPTPDMNAALTQVVATLQAGGTQTAEYVPPTETPAPEPTVVPTATRDPNRTPPALPAEFTTALLNPLDTPHTYVQDKCEYLKAKWDPNNAAPGTVVMPIMFHGIAKGEVNPAITGAYHDMTMKDFNRLMKDLKDLGFEAISMQQMADFMYHNANIPQRSVLLIVDDRKHRQSFDDTFFQY